MLAQFRYSRSENDHMTRDTSAKPKRRFLRFSLRTFLLVILVGCVALGWKVERARKQRETVNWIQQMGGMALYDYQIDDNFNPGPEWLRRHLGIDFPQRRS